MRRNIHFDTSKKDETSKPETLMEKLVREAKVQAEAEIEEAKKRAELEIQQEKNDAEKEIRRKIKDADMEIEAKRNRLNEEFEAQRQQLRDIQTQKEQEYAERETALQGRIDEVNRQIESTNARINNANFQMLEVQEIKSRNQELESFFAEYKKVLEKLLGRSITDEELSNILRDIKKQRKTAQTTTETIATDGIQPIKCANNGRSVFEYSNTGNWTEIGQLVLESKSTVNEFRFTDNKILALISKSGNIEVGKDGMVLEKGIKNNIIAVRIVIKEGDKYKNVYKFYSSSQVVPVYQFLSIANFILHIFQTDMKILGKESKASLECLVSSDKKYKSVKGCTFEKIDDGIYHLKYENSTYKDLKQLAMDIYVKLRCSKKGIPEEKISEIEQNAFIKSLQLSENGLQYDWIKNIKYVVEPSDLNR